MIAARPVAETAPYTQGRPLATQLYGLCGFIGSGKNTAGDVLIEATQGKMLSFAAPLKDGVSAIFGWDRTLIEGTTPEARAWREQPDEYWSGIFGRTITPRLILQEMGTDVCRAWLDDIWVAAAGRRHTPPQTSVFTDARFGNEMSWIAGQGGTLIWVYRPRLEHLAPEDATLIESYVTRNARLPFPIRLHSNLHVSETSFLAQGADLLHLVVRNTGTVEDLTLTMQHIHHILSHGDHLEMPWGQTTVYVDRDGKEFTWIYRDPNTDEQIGRVYNAAHVRVG
jgi:hypothetical protein